MHQQKCEKVWSNREVVLFFAQMILSLWYARSSTSVQLKRVACTIACNKVAKSTRKCSTRLCQRIYPRNLMSSFAFLEGFASMIAWTWPGSIATPSLETICPSSMPLRTTNAHLAGLRLNLVRHFRKHFVKYSMCSRSVLKSSKNDCMKFNMNSYDFQYHPLKSGWHILQSEHSWQLPQTPPILLQKLSSLGPFLPSLLGCSHWSCPWKRRFHVQPLYPKSYLWRVMGMDHWLWLHCASDSPRIYQACHFSLVLQRSWIAR